MVTASRYKTSRILLFSKSIVLLLAGFLFWTPAFAEKWEYGMNLGAGVIHTDNIFLDNDGLEQDELVYTLVPEFTLRRNDDRIEADIRYRPEAYFYQENSDADNVFHILDATLTTAFVRERLFLYLSAIKYQAIIAADGRFPTTNLPISSSKFDSQAFEIRPYWQQPIGRANMLVEAGYRKTTYDNVDLTNGLFQSNDESYGRFSLDNIEQQQGFSWGLFYDYRRIKYEISIPWEFQRAALELGSWVSEMTRIFAAGGAETPFDNLLDASMDSEFWEVGFQIKPSDRFNLELAAGERSYGSSFRGNFEYALRRGSISMSYVEGPSTRAELAFDRRPIRSSGILDQVADQPGGSDRFIRRRGDLSFGISMSKSTLTLRVFDEQREQLTTSDGTPLDDEFYRGVGLRWQWNVGAKTLFGVGADFTRRNDTISVGEDDLRSINLGISYQMSQRTSVRLQLINSKQVGQEDSQFDYSENQLRLMFHANFGNLATRSSGSFENQYDSFVF